MYSRFIFVYNAKHTIASRIFDSAHKLISPSTYNCSLCALTHDHIGQKNEWKNFLNSITLQVEFYHKDEYEKKFASKFAKVYQYPIILGVNGYDEDIICNAEQLNTFESLTEFIIYFKKFC